MRALAAQDPAPSDLHDGMWRKARDLCRLGFPILQGIVRGTRAAEQGHGFTAVQKNFDFALNAFLFSVLSFLHQSRDLLVEKRDTVGDRLERNFAKLKAIRFGTDGRGAFLREFVLKSLERLPCDARLHPNLMNFIVKHHGWMYRALPLSARRAYDSDAVVHAQEKRLRRDSQVESLEAELLRHRQRAAPCGGGTLARCYEHCQLSLLVR